MTAQSAVIKTQSQEVRSVRYADGTNFLAFRLLMLSYFLPTEEIDI